MGALVGMNCKLTAYELLITFCPTTSIPSIPHFSILTIWQTNLGRRPLSEDVTQFPGLQAPCLAGHESQDRQIRVQHKYGDLQDISRVQDLQDISRVQDLQDISRVQDLRVVVRVNANNVSVQC